MTATESENRLLPGDPAPALNLARVFNRVELADTVTFDRLSIVILWNAGCAGCLPVVGEIAELGALHGVPCYGVAVMVRDVDRTAAEAQKGNAKAILALEARPTEPTALARGEVTRNWLEASGQQGVPAGFLIGDNGVVLWMGDPVAVAETLPSVLARTWDVQAARRQWQEAIGDDAIAQLRIVREVTDVLVSGDVKAAKKTIAAAERDTPSVNRDLEFNTLKLRVLAAAGTREEALAHYMQTAASAAGDARLQSSLAAIVIKTFSHDRSALISVVDRLSMIGDAAAVIPHEAAAGMVCRLLQADAEIMLNLHSAAAASIRRADVLLHTLDLPPSVQAWAGKEIDRLRERITV